MTSRNFTFTLNNYTDEELELLRIENLPELVRYVVWGFEIGPECGTPHLQGYIELTDSVRYSKIKSEYPGLKRARFDKRKGTRDQARYYCMKGDQTDGEWWTLHATTHEPLRWSGPTFGLNAKWEEYGEWEAGGQGSRNDIKPVIERLKKGDRLSDVAMDNPLIYCKYRNGLKDIAMWVERENTWRFRKMNVHVIWGSAGVGKSKAFFDYTKKRNCCIATLDSNEFPIQLYDGEPTLIIDEFSGQVKHSLLLRILDGHQFGVNMKGGARYACWDTVFITSQSPPESWYPNLHIEKQRALCRRITSCKHATKDKIVDYKIPIIDEEYEPMVFEK